MWSLYPFQQLPAPAPSKKRTSSRLLGAVFIKFLLPAPALNFTKKARLLGADSRGFLPAPSPSKYVYWL